MAENERDSHFKGFAALLADEIFDALVGLGTTDFTGVVHSEFSGYDQAIQKIIAQRAYDFAAEIVYQCGDGVSFRAHQNGFDRVVSEIEDMTEFP